MLPEEGVLYAQADSTREPALVRNEKPDSRRG